MPGSSNRVDGLTPDKALAGTLMRLASQLSMPPDALVAIAAPLLKGGIELADLETALAESAAIWHRLRNSLAEPADTLMDPARNEAYVALGSGAFAAADKALAQAELAVLSGAKGLADLTAERRRAIADCRADRAALSAFRLQDDALREAARRYDEALTLLGDLDERRRMRFVLSRFDVLLTIAARLSDKAAAAEVEAKAAALAETVDGLADPVSFAALQERIGLAAEFLAEGDEDARRERVARIYRRALRDLMPADDKALHRRLQRRFADHATAIGQARGDEAWLGAAVNAARAVLDADIETGDAGVIAQSRSRLADVLTSLGAVSDQLAGLEEAFNLYQQAHAEVTRESDPLGWAAIWHGMGLALSTMGDRYKESIVLEEAIGAFGTALEERRAERDALLWARSHGERGLARLRLARRGGEAEAATLAAAEVAAAIDSVRRAGRAQEAATLEKRLTAAAAVPRLAGR